MFNSGRLRQRHFYDEILLTLTRQPLQQVDSAVTQGVSLSIIFLENTCTVLSRHFHPFQCTTFQ